MLNVQSLNELDRLMMNGDPGVIMYMKMVQLVGSVGSFIVPAHLFALLTQGEYKSFFGFETVPTKIKFIWVCCAMLAAQPLINAMAAWNESMSLPSFLSGLEEWMKQAEAQNKKITDYFLKMDSPYDILLNMLIVAVIPAFGEEMFFRGAMQKTILSWNGNVHKSVWISAFVFSFFHFQFYGFLPRMVMGAMLGYMMIWSGSIWLPVIAHFTNNASAVLLSYLVQHNYLPESVEQVGSVSEEIIYTIISSVVVVFLMYLLYKSRTRHTTTSS